MKKDLLRIAPELTEALKSVHETPAIVCKDKESSIESEWNNLRNIVHHYYPAIWPQTKAFLAAIACISISDNPLPIAIIASGPSGSGKTEPLDWITSANHERFYRSDNFTPKAFVSHCSSVKRDKLDKIDMLPRIKDKVMVTKELSPLFRGREEELTATFSMLTTILDGQGYTSDSGTQGQRGYKEPINFTWLGATTPFPSRTFSTMAALGTRLFFFSTDSTRPTAPNLANVIKGRRKQNDAKGKCRAAMKRYLDEYFECYPARSISIDSFVISDEISQCMGVYCLLMSHLRGGISISEGRNNEDDRYGHPEIEHGWRSAQVVRALLAGSALLRGSQVVNEDDVALIKRICMSSMPEYRRLVLEACISKGGSVSAGEISRMGIMAKKTALHYGKEMALLEVFNIVDDREPYVFELRDEFHLLLESEMHTSANTVTPNKGKQAAIGEQLTMRNLCDKGVTKNVPVCELDEAVQEVQQIFPGSNIVSQKKEASE